METVIQNPQPHQPRQQSEDEQAKNLFDDLSMSEGNPFQNLQLSSQNQQSQPLEENAGDDNKEGAIDFRQMMKISKKQKKKEKKMRKIKQAKGRKQSRKQNRNENIKESQKSNNKPGKKMLMDSQEDEASKQSKPEQQSINLKIKKSSKKVIKHSDDEDKLASDKSDDSDEYSSENKSSQDEELGRMDPNSEEQGSGKKQFKKKLGKKSRKQRILQKQGFDLRELGNDASANYELNQSVDQSDDSFSDGGRKKKGSKRVKKDKKEKKHILTNEQFLGKLQELGREDQADQNDADRYNYDSGLNQLQKLRPKKESQNKIKVQNKYFGNLEMDIQDEPNDQNQVQMPEEKLQLDIKPKSATSSRASSFLNKVQALKKHRGLQADINQEEFDKMTKEKAKRSISQLMSKIQNQVEENEEIDIQIKAPTIAKGKSADLINNTMFIVKNLSQKQQSTVSSSDNTMPTDAKNAAGQQLNKVAEKPQEQKLMKNQSSAVAATKNRKGVSRSQFFKQIKESISMRKSKYISDEELKNSMKSSKLQELEEIRKKIQQKRRKDAMYEMGELEDDDADNVINELEADLAKHQGVSIVEFKKLIQMEEGIMGGLEDYELDEEKKKKKKQTEEQNQQPKVVLELSLEQPVNPTAQISQKPSQQSVEQIKLKKLFELKKQLKIQKAIAMEEGQQIQEEESDRHADDLIEDYSGAQADEKNEMDLENQGDDQADEEEEQDGDYQQEGEEQEEIKNQQADGQQDEPKEEDQLVSLSNKINNQTQNINHEENPQLRNQLEQQGIIMPGNKKKPNPKHNEPQPQVDFSKYMVENQNGQPIIPQTLNEPTKQPSNTPQQTLQFKQFRKLRKFAVVIQQKKKKRQQQLKRAKQFFQQQAQLGSDNQQNDDNIKTINKKDDEDQQDGDHLDQQLQQLIDNAVDINEADEQQAFKKYMEDVKEKDRQELQRILRGEFRRPNQDMPEMQEMEEDQKNRIQRMERMVEWMKKREDDQKDLYAKDDSEDDDIKYYYDKNGKKKRIQNKKNISQDNLEDSPEQDNGELEKKLQFYLMDTISPAKKETEIEINTDLIMELPLMNKKSTMSKLSTFARKSQQPIAITQSHPDQPKQTPNKSAFSGNWLSLAAPKGQNNNLSMPKVKKTSSHMSEVLNKNKSHKPTGFSGTGLKLPGIFTRLGKK